MSLPSAVHVSSTFESAAPRMSLPSAVHQFSILQFYWETHECHCLALFMCPSPSGLEPRECHCLALFANSPFSTFFRSPMNVIA